MYIKFTDEYTYNYTIFTRKPKARSSSGSVVIIHDHSTPTHLSPISIWHTVEGKSFILSIHTFGNNAEEVLDLIFYFSEIIACTDVF